MVKRTGPTNKELKETILALKRTKKKIWQRTAELLEKPSRQRRTINVFKLKKKVRTGETIIVPGKVLGNGNLDKQFTISAWQFSKQAEKKLKDAKCAVLSIQDMIKKKPKEVRIIT